MLNKKNRPFIDLVDRVDNNMHTAVHSAFINNSSAAARTQSYVSKRTEQLLEMSTYQGIQRELKNVE